MPRTKPVFTFRRTEDQASSWDEFQENLIGARADDAWRSVVEAWCDGSLVHWLERQVPNMASCVKELGNAGNLPVKRSRQEKLASALFAGTWPDCVRMTMDADEREQLQAQEEKHLREEGKKAEELRLFEMAKQGKDWTATLPGGVKLELVWVEPGTFIMGASEESFDEQPHEVTLSKGYWIGRYPITQEQWDAMNIKKGHQNYWLGNKLPVEMVEWDETICFCNALTKELEQKLPIGYYFDLPTEAQWEFAARGGIRTQGFIYSGSDKCDEVAWYDCTRDSCTHEVGQKKENELGIFDMSGNVWEWCRDWYGLYPNMSINDPRGPSNGSDKVCRGGRYLNKDYTLVSARYFEDVKSGCSWFLGFRIVLTS